MARSAAVRRHLAREVLVDRDAGVAERRLDRDAIEAKRVIDRSLSARGTAVREDIASDLAERRFEKDERAIVLGATDRLPQPLDGSVQDLQSFIKVGERRGELKAAVSGPHRLKTGEGFLDCCVIRKDAIAGGELHDHTK